MKYNRILFVCTGNICRSPMAEAIFKDMAQTLPELQPADIEVRSAGTLNLNHHRASDEAVQVMQERGLAIGSHRSRQIDQELVGWADIVLAMADEHRGYLLGQFPYAKDKVHLLSEFAREKGEVPDPIGQGLEVYRECADRITYLLSASLVSFGIYSCL